MNAFDYASLDPETRIVVQQRTGEIKSLVRRSVADVIDIGGKLAEVKARLQHGQFGDWLEGEFGWSHDTAGRFLNVAAQFGQIPQQDVARNGSAYQPALRVRLPLDAKTSDVRVAARALRGQPTPDVALAAVNGAGGERPTPAIVRPAPSQSATARDLSLDELRAGLLQLLTLPHSATNADILSAVGTLQSAFEVSHE